MRESQHTWDACGVNVSVCVHWVQTIRVATYHKDDVTHSRHIVGIDGGHRSVHLCQNLFRAERAQQPHRPRRAKGASLPAADLR